MSSKTITLSLALQQIKSGKEFDIEFVKADVGRHTGGAMKVGTRCRITRIGRENTQNVKSERVEPVQSKMPRHFENSTLNIYVNGGREVVKVHPRLITMLNGFIVT